MTLNEYQEFTSTTAVYPVDEGLWYTALGLAGEAGEVAGKVSKIIRDRNGIPTELDKKEIAKELGDVAWFLARLADELGYELAEIIDDNAAKLISRKERGVLGGSGDNR